MDNGCFSTKSFVRAGAKKPNAKFPYEQGCRNKALGQRFIDTDQDSLSQLWELFNVRPSDFVSMCTSVSVKSPQIMLSEVKWFEALHEKFYTSPSCHSQASSNNTSWNVFLSCLFWGHGEQCSFRTIDACNSWWISFPSLIKIHSFSAQPLHSQKYILDICQLLFILLSLCI